MTARKRGRQYIQQRSDLRYSVGKTRGPNGPGREDGAAGVVDVLVQGVARQRLLELDELRRVLPFCPESISR